ncbi:hypothetical protein Ciccas_008457 [Cichlidogyrus casuarinus]|uniref:Uncharacterized protein n=1 Tax=Cichlidogyrus casuarinus TaxID=1844966 RepID=A0ABD2PZW5_9PLAT
MLELEKVQNLVLGGIALILMLVALSIDRWPADILFSESIRIRGVAGFMLISTICHVFVFVYDIVKSFKNDLDGRVYIIRLVSSIVSAACAITGLTLIADDFRGLTIAISGGSVFIALAICFLLSVKLTK